MIASTADDNVLQVWQVAYEQYYNDVWPIAYTEEW
jgi:hypothetical protein